MAQRGTRHSQIVDDQMAAETHDLRPTTSSRAEHWRDAETPVEDESGGLPLSAPPRGAAPEGMSTADVEGRFELARYLDTGRFPADAAEVRQMAEAAHAPDSVLADLATLPDGTYQTVNEVWASLGHGVERRREI